MFNEKTKNEIKEAQNNYCKYNNCINKIHSVHHKLHDTTPNRNRFPLFIDSPMNGVGLCDKHHRDKQHEFRITDKEAKVYEDYLRSLKNGSN